ncbi:MAG: PAS domain S-box protein [Nitrospinaceae bacterium]|nr:PAS domain S-box protein [Nitrospina sp.]MBT5867861.1 PAS domain S-box protein [Nitrospinaceae bacterium]
MTREVHNQDQELEQRVRRIMLLRVFFLTGFVGLLLTFQERLGITAPIEPLCRVIGTGFFMSLIYAALFKVLTLKQNASMQVAGDLLLVGGILYTTGGIDSPISFLFLFVIIATSVTLPRAATYLAASGAIIIYGVLVDLEYYGIITPVYLFPEAKVSFESGYVFYVIFLNIVSYYTVAYLSSFLSHRLRMVKEELQQASISLEEQRAFNRNIVQNMGSGLITTNLYGIITSINPAARFLIGYSIGESLEKPVDQLIPLAELNALFLDNKKPNLPKQIEGEYKRKDGKIIFIRIKISHLTDLNIEGYILVFEDLTEVKGMQEIVLKTSQLAAVGRFSAGLAHEIRNPLTSLSGSIQVLARGLKLEDSYKKLMQIVIKETDRLNAILSDFLNYSQPKKNINTIIDLTQLVQDIIILLKNKDNLSDTKQIQFKGASDHLILNGDEEQIKQVVWNLCINALESMSEGIVTLTLKEVSSFHIEKFQSNQRGMVLEVQDEGCGISPEQINNIYDPFYSSKKNGVGLGLATVYQIVNRNEGTLDVQSTVGKGTLFTVFLPDQESEKPIHTY